MAWPGNRRQRRAQRDGALGYEHRIVGYSPYVPAPQGLDPWGRPWDIASEGRWNLENPPGGPTFVPPDYNPPISTYPSFPPPEDIIPCPPIRYNTEVITPGCPVAPGSLRYIAETRTIPAGGTGVFFFDSPGIFCPQRLIVIADDVEFMFITKIATGTRNQIISGAVPAEVYSTANNCCPFACLDCMCAPGVKLEINILNTDVTVEDVTVALVGTYYDIPAGMTAKEAGASIRKDFPGCPIPGSEKLLGFSQVIPANATTAEIAIETPGRFCPKRLVFSMNPASELNDFFVTGIQTTLDEAVILGRIPVTLWSIQNECCVVSCFECLCAPGVPMRIKLGVTPDESSRVLNGMMSGDYEDAC